MITGLLLVCMLGARDDCYVQQSPTFFETVEHCENTNKAVVDRINKSGEYTYYILDTTCVVWGDAV